MKTTSTKLNAIEKYKNELMIKLNLSKEELDKKFKSTLYSFKNEMESIGNNNFIQSIMKLNYNEMVEFDKEEENIGYIQCEHNIYDKNVDTNKDCFLCICGKAHLKNLHLFEHEDLEGKQLVIGSSCIKQVEKLKMAYAENKELCDKLNTIISDLKDAEKVKKYKSCYKCKDLCINKTTDYKFPHMKNYCRYCLVGKTHSYIKCSRCKIKVLPASQPLPYDNNKFKEICGKCWHHENKNKQWYKKKYNSN